MTPRVKKLLDIAKRPKDAPPEQKVGGTDPMDQWSAQNKISESPSLNKYLLSRGFDPNHTPKDVKVAHSKSNQFKNWQRQHIGEDLTTQHTGSGGGVDHKTDLSVSPTKKRLNRLVKAKAHYNIPTPPGTMRKEAVDDTTPKLNDYQHKQAIKRDLPKHTVTKTPQGSGAQLRGTIESVELDESEDYWGKESYAMIKKSHEHYKDSQAAKARGDHAEHDRLLKLTKDTHKAAMEKAKEYHASKDPKDVESKKKANDKMWSSIDTGHGKGRYMGDSVELDGDQLDEISLGDYKQKAQAQTKELKKHTKGEYSGIVNRMLGRRNKGLKMVTNREKKIETESDMTEGWAVNGSVLSDDKKKDKRSASEKMSDYAVKRHKIYQDIGNKQKEMMKKWNDDHKDEPHLQVTIPEDVGDAMAAIKGVGIPISLPNSQPEKEQQKESRASKIKALYKKKMAEDTYDSEKDDKYGQNPTFGKKPVMQTDAKGKQSKNMDGIKTKAAAVLTGGTTLTGQKRDTVQIDPDLNNPRPGQSDPNGDRNNK